MSTGMPLEDLLPTPQLLAYYKKRVGRFGSGTGVTSLRRLRMMHKVGGVPQEISKRRGKIW